MATLRSKHIHITGASGSGVSTLGRLLADHSGMSCFDTDDFYWLPTDPPYREKRTVSDRMRLLEDNLDRTDGWVVSGSLDGWGDSLIPRFDLVIFLYVPAEICLQRLSVRERRRFGAALERFSSRRKDPHPIYVDNCRRKSTSPFQGEVR